MTVTSWAYFLFEPPEHIGTLDCDKGIVIQLYARNELDSDDKVIDRYYGLKVMQGNKLIEREAIPLGSIETLNWEDRFFKRMQSKRGIAVDIDRIRALKFADYEANKDNLNKKVVSGKSR